MPKFLTALLLCVLPFFVMAQKSDEAGTYDWKLVDSLFSRGRPKSAAQEAEKLYQKAQKEGRKAEAVRAQIYILHATSQLASGDTAAIAMAERRAGEGAFPQNAIWKNMVASLYQDYYNDNRWKIMQRTRTATVPADFRQWDATRFMERIGDLYRSSLKERDKLAAISLNEWEPLLVPRARSTRTLRPSLYDLLSYRALEFFSRDPIDLPRSADYFVLDDKALFLPADQFSKTNFKKGDTSALAFRAVRIYQQLLLLHAGDANKDAFLDADLQRLEYLHNNGVMQHKDSLYQAALLAFTAQNGDNPSWSLARYRWAQMSYYRSPEREDGPEGKAPADRLLKLRAEMENIIARFPESEGGKLAQNRLDQLLLPSVELTAAQAELPGVPTKVLVTYRNTNRVFIRVAALPADFERRKYSNRDTQTAEILSRKAVQQFTVDLPASEDLKRHSVEVPLEALPLGNYAVIWSSSNTFKAGDSLLGYAPFQITELAFIIERSPDTSAVAYVVNRRTGAPEANVKVSRWRREWIASKNVWQKDSEETKTDASGRFKFSGNTSDLDGVELQKGTDRYFGKTNFYRYHTEENEDANKVFIFTDRSIYRPGQTVYFKAIAIFQNEKKTEAKVAAGMKLELEFSDANNNTIAEQELTTNEWGSVSGSFTAPAGGLTGEMTIDAYGELPTDSNKYFEGEITISVEEYKRPKFYVEPDALKGNYALKEEVKIEMQALAYSGVPLDGAAVKYRVVRRQRSYWWWFRHEKNSYQTTLAEGTLTTNSEGKFLVSFVAQPDPSAAEKYLPVFTYTVYADVTDQNGETHSAEQTMQAGYRALELRVVIGSSLAAEALDNVAVTTTNIAGNFLPASVQIKVERLQAPEVFYRKRLWGAPDQHLLSEPEFHKLFPNDPYADENDFYKWESAETVYNATFASSPGGKVALPAVFKKNGWYRFTISTKDKNEAPVETQRWSHVWVSEGAGKPMVPIGLLSKEVDGVVGQEVKLKIISTFKNAHLFQTVENGTDDSKREWRTLKRSPLLWKKRITEADRGGFSNDYFTVHNNRYYESVFYLAVPHSNKELNLTWETHRDKVKPGSRETWTLVVKGKEKDKAAAELAAVLYDASLDALKPHDWDFKSLFPTYNLKYSWNSESSFSQAEGQTIHQPQVKEIESETIKYSRLMDPVYRSGWGIVYNKETGDYEYAYMDVKYSKPLINTTAPGSRSVLSEVSIMKMAVRDVASSLATTADVDANTGANANPAEPNEADAQSLPAITIRKNLQETAFFFPQLTADATGAVRLTFEFPEALTEWKLLALAHTKNMATGTLTGKVKTQKELMVVPQLPRFFRQGDTIVINAKITNASAVAQMGTALLEIKDAATELSQALPFRIQNAEAPFSVGPNSSTTVTWRVTVPQSRYEPVLVAISARTATFTDGEQIALPVITNRMLVTETLPLWMNGNGEKTFKWDALLASGKTTTLAQHAVTVEYTTNPAWYALQALPSLLEYPYDCAEQCFNRYYAAALGSHILSKAPRVKAVFEKWQKLDTAALLSNLEKNPELKSALLEETPWVLEAKSERTQKRSMGDLFASYKLSQTLYANAQKLEAMLLPSGAFPWFKGDQPNAYITRYIVAGIGKLQKLGIEDKFLERISKKCLPYLDSEVEREYKELLRLKADLKTQQVGPGMAHYFYMRSFFGGAPKTTATTYFSGQLEQFWPKFGLFSQGLTALYAQRTGKPDLVKNIHQSIIERSTYKEEMGRYWPQQQRSWWWYEAPIETQALLIESFVESGLTDTADEARRWLLKNKQTNSWPTTRATADACYVLLLQGTQWLTAEPQVQLQLGSTTISNAGGKTEAGTGYFKRRIEGKDVAPEMGNIKLAVSGAGTAAVGGRLPTWGAVYWQYFEDLDNIEATGSSLNIKKGIWMEEATPKGLELRPMSAGRALKVGDRVVVRIEIATDRDMEYIHLKDARAAGFEPVNVLSGYRYKDGLGYYESTRDVSSNFFISYLRKGKYVFEYPLFAVQAGAYSAGLATIQCMYAPEFLAHTEGVRVEIKP